MSSVAAAVWEGAIVFSLMQVLGHGLVELLFIVGRVELERQGRRSVYWMYSVTWRRRVRWQKVPKAVPQALDRFAAAGVLRPKGVRIPENHVIEDRRQAVQFQQRVLQRRGREQQLSVDPPRPT